VAKKYVALKKCESYDPRQVDKAVKSACFEAGFPNVRGRKVLLKPNILSDVPPEKAVTTHPEVLRAVIAFVRQLGGLPYVGDSPALHLSSFTGKKSGLRTVCEESGAEWIDFSKKTIKISYPSVSSSVSSSVKKSFTVTSAVRDCDVIISLPKMKTHQLMYMTGAVKNLFGLIPGLGKSPFHLRHPDRNSFADMLLDLYEITAPVFSLMDGIIAMEGPGPNSGTPKFMGLILASADGIALDLAAAHIMGYNYASIPIIQQAVKRNLLTPDGLDQISFVLGTPEEFRDDSFLRISQEAQRGLARTALGFIKNRLVKPIPAAKPIFDKEKCIGCGQCAEICPADALVMQGIEHEYVSADYNKCIRCYCCHEICPVDAITIEQGRRR
jgi:uncharacterized protein (DUF362 family)/Pyruvate/2-oxoacid:ferredoxin oxidoreductase delta subunit